MHIFCCASLLSSPPISRERVNGWAAISQYCCPIAVEVKLHRKSLKSHKANICKECVQLYHVWCML